MFITRQPLGLIATPGTYLSIEAYSENVRTRVISHSVLNSSDIIVHQPSSNLDIKKYDFKDARILESISSEVIDFKPDIVCIGCFAPVQRRKKNQIDWSDVAQKIKLVSPNSKIILEVKSPLLANGILLETIQERLAPGQRFLDAIIAPSLGAAKTWLPNILVPFLGHRLIFDRSSIVRKSTFENDCRKIVFSGSLAKKRKIDQLVHFIANLPQQLLNTLSIDFYGDGPAKKNLILLVEELSLSKIIRFKGALPQKELFKIYCQYDAGLAWVPSEKYNSAPSLKLTEYCAAGLIPIATNTEGHRLLTEYGFKVEFFNETADSFSEVMERIVQYGFPSDNLIKNLKLAEKSDYQTVINEEILPFYRNILKSKISIPATNRSIDDKETINQRYYFKGLYYGQQVFKYIRQTVKWKMN